METAQPRNRDCSQPASAFRLGFAFLGAPFAWTAHFLINYGLVAVACDTGWASLLYITTVVATLIAAGAGVVGWRLWRRARQPAHVPGPGVAARQGFLGFTSILISGFFTLFILVEGTPPLVLDACA